MIEILFVLYILLLFIFPVPTLSASLGAVTCYFLFRKHYLFSHQPQTGRKLLGVYWVLGFQNFALSAGLAVLLSLMVYILIFNNYFLFLFNFLLCFSVALRWFDFSYSMFRSYAVHGMKSEKSPSASTPFGMVIGMRPHSGLGLGLAPVFLDAGSIRLGESTVQFEGTFFRETFRPGQFTDIKKVSSEKIRIIALPENRRSHATEYLLVVREQFYPFRSRSLRDRIFRTLSPQTETLPRSGGLDPTATQPWPSAG